MIKDAFRLAPLPLVLIGMLLAGCQPSADELRSVSPTIVELISEPAGATLTDGKSFSEVAPFEAEIRFKGLRDDDCFRLAKVTAIWPSGANVTQDVQLCGEPGTTFTYRFERPESFPGVEEDEAYGQQVEQKGKRIQIYLDGYWGLSGMEPWGRRL